MLSSWHLWSFLWPVAIYWSIRNILALILLIRVYFTFLLFGLIDLVFRILIRHPYSWFHQTTVVICRGSHGNFFFARVIRLKIVFSNLLDIRIQVLFVQAWIYFRDSLRLLRDDHIHFWGPGTWLYIWPLVPPPSSSTCTQESLWLKIHKCQLINFFSGLVERYSLWRYAANLFIDVIHHLIWALGHMLGNLYIFDMSLIKLID